jgi:hypothetical protein
MVIPSLVIGCRFNTAVRRIVQIEAEWPFEGLMRVH